MNDIITLGDIVAVEFCNKCFEHSFFNDHKLVFHSITPENLEKHPGNILKPENIDAPSVERAPNYEKFLDKEYVHLGPLSITGISSDKLYFAFDIKKLKQEYPDIEFINHYVWEMLGFQDRPQKPTDYLKPKLHVDDYKYDNEDPIEVLLPSLDISLAESVIVGKPTTLGGIKIISGMERFEDITKKYHDNLDKDCDCSPPSEQKPETEQDKLRLKYIEDDCKACELDCKPCFYSK